MYKILQNSPYYSSIITDYKSFGERPSIILTDEVIKSKKYEILDKHITPAEMKLLYGKKKAFNGNEIETYWSYDSLQKNFYELSKMRKKWFGIRAIDKNCINHKPGRGHNPYQIIDDIYVFPHGNCISFSCDNIADAFFEKCLWYMCKLQPIWVSFEYNFAFKFNEYINKYKFNYPLSIKFEEVKIFNFNKLEPNNFDLPFNKSYIGCNPIVSEYTYECPMHYHHVLNNLNFIEKVDSHEYCITNRINDVFPIIRYPLLVTDIISNYKCECGLTSDVII